jgi:hypothetical protein
LAAAGWLLLLPEVVAGAVVRWVRAGLLLGPPLHATAADSRPHTLLWEFHAALAQLELQ